MAKSFTLHHHIPRPVSVHYHRPVARTIHAAVISASIAFLAVTLWLFWIAYRDIINSRFAYPALFLLASFVAGVILLIVLTVYGEKMFYREIGYLKRRYKFEFLHAKKRR